jgi:hypothetical protein
MSAPAVSTAETVGRLIEQITEFIGPDASMSFDVSANRGSVWIHNLDPQRFPLHNSDQPLAPLTVFVPTSGRGHALNTRSTTLLGALRNAAAYLVFPPEVAGTHLRIVGGAL